MTRERSDLLFVLVKGFAVQLVFTTKFAKITKEQQEEAATDSARAKRPATLTRARMGMG